MWGAVWFVVATVVVLPAVNPGGEWAYAEKADPLRVLTDPAVLFDPAKGETLALILVCSAALVLRSPLALLLLPTLAWRFLSPNSGYWAPTWHYSAVLIPIALVALLDGIERGRRSRAARMREYTRLAPAIAVTAAVVLLPGLPLFSLVTAEGWEPSPRAASARGAVDAVPEGASVVSDIGLMNYLVGDHDVFWIGNANPQPDCLVIDTVAGGTPGEWGDVIAVGSGCSRRLSSPASSMPTGIRSPAGEGIRRAGSSPLEQGEGDGRRVVAGGHGRRGLEQQAGVGGVGAPAASAALSTLASSSASTKPPVPGSTGSPGATSCEPPVGLPATMSGYQPKASAEAMSG